MRILCLVALLALSLAPTSIAAEPDDTLTFKLRQLEERAVRAEERLARLEKATAVVIPEAIPFGDVVVNLGEDRQQRYLRIKLAIRVSDANHKEMSTLVQRKKSELRSWAITYLTGQPMNEVSGSSGVIKVQADLKKGFGKILGNGKENPILEILFDEYMIQ